MQRIEAIADNIDSTREDRPRWLAVLTGLNAAIAISYLLCKPPHAHTLSFLVRLITSASYILIVCLAGAVGTRIALPRESRHQFWRLVLWGGRCWVFLPAVMVFLQEKSILATLIASLSACLMAVYLSHTPAVAAYRSSQQGSYNDIDKHIFITQLHFEPLSWTTVAISVCLYGAVTSAIAHSSFFLTPLLAVGSFLLISQIITKLSGPRNQATPKSRPYTLLAWALLSVFVSLTVPGQMHQVHIEDSLGSLLRSERHAPHQAPSAGYRTIVLWPPPKREKIIVTPSFAIDTTAGHRAKPWVIPFDGPYWYFKFADESPGPLARNAHGDPLKVSVRSTDSSPLLMEAHQYLATSVDLACCREIRVVLRNDLALGASQVGILLTDSHAKSKSYQSLGIKPIASSSPDWTSENAFPIEETVSFSIPRHGTIKEFDQITVVLLPHNRHATAGRKVSVERFIMIPE